MSKILLVEDNQMIVKGLKYMLEQKGFEVDVASLFKTALTLMDNIYDLVILDITLPDGDGMELGHILKDNNRPFLFLTAKDEEDKIVEGLDLGAYDYITKPFRNNELLSRINNILKRTSTNNIEIGNITINLDRCEVTLDKRIVDLTSLEYKILALLVINKNKVVTRDVIIDKIWDMEGNFVNDNTLSVYIKRIRSKLNNENIIKTIKGIGYRVDI